MMSAAGELPVNRALAGAREKDGERSRMSSAAHPHADERLINIDVLGALRRRKWIGLAVALLGVVGTVVFVMGLPATYKSTATVLIEEPDVPQDLVKSTVSNYAND